MKNSIFIQEAFKENVFQDLDQSKIKGTLMLSIY